MARAAGMHSDKAKIVATAAQFVDDNAHKESLELKDGARIDSHATAKGMRIFNCTEPSIGPDVLLRYVSKKKVLAFSTPFKVSLAAKLI